MWLANAHGQYGLAHAETSDANKIYVYKSMMKLLETYPDLDGFGVTNGENKSNQDFYGLPMERLCTIMRLNTRNESCGLFIAGIRQAWPI